MAGNADVWAPITGEHVLPKLDGEMIVGDGTNIAVLERGATLRSSIGVGTTDVPTFDGLNLTGNLGMTNGFGVNFALSPQAAGMTSELFNDYEEGLFTPILTSATGSGTITYLVQEGSYTKIGRLVFFECDIKINSLASRTGAISLTGLPVVSANSTPLTAVASGRASGLAINAGENIGVMVAPFSSTAYLYLWDDTGGTTNLDVAADVASMTELYLASWYRTT